MSYHCRHDQPHCRGLTSLPQNKSWHHRWADTAPLAWLCSARCRSQPPSAVVMWHLCSGILLIYIQSEGRLSSSSPSSSFFTDLPEEPASLPSPLFLRYVHADADGSTNNPPSLSLPSPLHLSRPLLLTHQRLCTAYSLPAATMETGVVVYDSERPVCREIDRKGDTQRQGKKDKERDLLTRSVHQWLHVDGIKSACFEGTVSCLYYSDVSSLMLVP